MIAQDFPENNCFVHSLVTVSKIKQLYLFLSSSYYNIEW